MLRMGLRIVVGFAGLFALAIASMLWLNPEGPARTLGLSADGVLGVATLRADLGGFFGVAGAFALAAAVRGEARLLTAPLLAIAIALSGRIVTLALSANAAVLFQSMAIEVLLLAIFGAGRLLMEDALKS